MTLAEVSGLSPDDLDKWVDMARRVAEIRNAERAADAERVAARRVRTSAPPWLR